jgi:hypothetical protein
MPSHSIPCILNLHKNSATNSGVLISISYIQVQPKPLNGSPPTFPSRNFGTPKKMEPLHLGVAEF